MSNSVLPSSAMHQKTQQKVVSPLITAGNPITATNNNNVTNNKRVKVTLACAVCRKKKVKCDGIQPTCSRCNSMGFSCQYSDPPKKRGPPKGQVEIIESRAHRIESLRVGSVSQNNHKTASVMNMVREHCNLDYPLVNEVNNNNNKLFEPENNTILHLISGAVDALHTNKWVTTPSSLDYQGTPGSHYIKNDFFMKDDLMISNYQKWTSCYFGYFNVFFPVLSQPHFIRQLSQQQVDPLLLYAVCTIGSKYSDHGKESTHLLFERCQAMLHLPREPITLSTVQALVILCWYAYLLGNMQLCCDLRQRLNQATNELQLHRDPGSSFGIVSIEMRRRAFWVVFVTDQWLSCCTGVRYLVRQSSWNCQWPQLEDSQLHVIDSKQWKPESPHSNLSDDRKNQPNHHHTDNSPPDHMPDLSTEYALQITAFSEMIKLSSIVYDVYDLHATFSSTTSQKQQAAMDHLTDWLLRLPPYLEYGKPTDDSPPSPIARIYHMLYYTVQIMIHQSFVRQWDKVSSSAVSSPPLPPSEPASPNLLSSSLSPLPKTSNTPDSNMSLSICTNAANTIIHIAEQIVQYKQQKYLYNTFLTSLTLATSVHLNNTLHSDQIHGASSLLNLIKSSGILKSCNCSLLHSMELGQLLDRYLLDRCGMRLYETPKEQHLQSPSRRPSSSVKRTSQTVKLEAHDNVEPPRKRRTPQHQKNLIAPHQQQQPSTITTTPSSIEPHQPPHLAMPSPTSLTGWDNSSSDDLLDTRLHSLLHDFHPYSSTTTSPPFSSSSTASTLSPPASISSNHYESVQGALDPTWLSETNSIFDDLFPDAIATNSTTTTTTTTASPLSQYHHHHHRQPHWLSSPTFSQPMMTAHTLYSPLTSNSPTQSPTLSSDSNLHAAVTPVTDISHYLGGNECDLDYFKLPSNGSIGPPASDTQGIYDFMAEYSLILPYSH